MRSFNRGEPLARPPSHLLRPTTWASTAEYAAQEEGVITPLLVTEPNNINIYRPIPRQGNEFMLANPCFSFPAQQDRPPFILKFHKHLCSSNSIGGCSENDKINLRIKGRCRNREHGVLATQYKCVEAQCACRSNASHDAERNTYPKGDRNQPLHHQV